MAHRNEKSFKLNDIMFMTWEDDDHQYISGVDEDEAKLARAGKALRKQSNWTEVKLGPCEGNPGLYVLSGKRPLEKRDEANEALEIRRSAENEPEEKPKKKPKKKSKKKAKRAAQKPKAIAKKKSKKKRSDDEDGELVEC